MSLNGRKYHLEGEQAFPHAGNMVEQYVKQNVTNLSAFARKLNIMPSTIRQYFGSDSLQMGILWKLSQVTNHNFIMEIGSQLPIDYPTPTVLKLQQEVESLKAEVAALQKQVEMKDVEISVYKTVVGK